MWVGLHYIIMSNPTSPPPASTTANNGPQVAYNNIFFYLWVGSMFISTCYTMTWDFKMDWGLLDKNAGENTLLREEIVYGYKVCLGE